MEKVLHHIYIYILQLHDSSNATILGQAISLSLFVSSCVYIWKLSHSRFHEDHVVIMYIWRLTTETTVPWSGGAISTEKCISFGLVLVTMKPRKKGCPSGTQLRKLKYIE